MTGRKTKMPWLISVSGLMVAALCAAPLASVKAQEGAVASEPLPVEEPLGTPPESPQVDQVVTSESAPASTDVVITDTVTSAPAPSQDQLEQEVPDDVFFDAGQLAPGPGVTQSTAPTKVDPREQPGSRFIVVRQNEKEGSYESTLVAAGRALKLGRYSSAMEMFNTLYKKNSRDPRVLMGLAVAQQKSGLTESSIRTYEELLKRDPNNKEALVNMLGIMKDQYPEVALRRLLDLQQKYPNHPGVSAQIGMTHAAQGQYDAALKYLGIAISLEPDNAVHFFNMAVIADRKGAKDQAIDWYEQALQIDAAYGASRSIPRDTVYDRLSTLRRL